VRLPRTAESLRLAASVGLQDSMPRAAVLSLHARIDGIDPIAWEDPVFVQLWGPRYQVYVVAVPDLPLFSLSRLPDGGTALHRAEDLAARLHDHLDGRTMTYGEAGRGIGVNPNALRYAAATGTVLIRWAGARAPTVWTVPRPPVDPLDARAEVARRYLRAFGPTTAAAFAKWAGVSTRAAAQTFETLRPSLVAAHSPTGEGLILAEDEAGFRTDPGPSAPARLLPSGDAYYLLWGEDRALLVPDARRRDQLWTSRVWPGAVLVDGEVRGTWRRAHDVVTVDAWDDFTDGERDAVEAEAATLPLPGLDRPIVVNWES
jgi:hypothetical protein